MYYSSSYQENNVWTPDHEIHIENSKNNDNGIITVNKYATETIGNNTQEIQYEDAVQKIKEEQLLNNELVPSLYSGKRYSMKRKGKSIKRKGKSIKRKGKSIKRKGNTCKTMKRKHKCKAMKNKSIKHKHSKKLCRH